MTLDISLVALFQLSFYVLALVFVVHAVVLAYHWIYFGVHRSTSMIGVTVYLGGGAILLGLLSIALFNL